jgi:glycosyltransferase involved in cell wall biosynthesis
MTKTKVAFIKFGGLAAGGTERFIQNIAANLPKNYYDVTYFYCDSAPYVGSDWKHPDTDPARKKFMEEAGVRLVKFTVGAKDVTRPHHPWLETNFFSLFNEEDYDIIQTGRAGHAEFPFTEIHKTAIVDAITLPGMAENKPNVAKVIHISQFQADSWVAAGGDASKCVIVPIFSDTTQTNYGNLRKELGISREAFVYGMHQRVDDGIASPVPLQAFKQLGDNDAHFIIMGGGEKYSEWAKDLGLQNFHHLPHSGDNERLAKFLHTLNVYTHGRADGETFGLAIAEGMSVGLPIISHVAPAMGHKETIGDAGLVVDSVEAYAAEMKLLNKDKKAYAARSALAESVYKSRLSTAVNMKKIIKIYEEIMKKKAKDDLPDEDFWEDMWEDGDE